MLASNRQSDPAPSLLVLLLTILIIISAASLAFGGQRDPGPDATATLQPGAFLPLAIDKLSDVLAVDGDTFQATIELWPDLSIHTKIRIAGIDAPELKSRCAKERAMAVEAREALGFLLEGPIRLRNVRRDKFGGRFIADGALADGSDLAATLISAGFARAYDGGKRQPWC